MKLLRIYVDTSVFGGCFDPEFALWSNALMDDFRSYRFKLVVSDITAAEIAPSPRCVQKLFSDISNIAEQQAVTEEALQILHEYERHAVLGPRFRNDMLHIAVATATEVDVVVSWNFKHIVRLDKIRSFNGINIELGYKALAIHSPREVTSHGKEE